jgi:hypothetical protein
MDSGPVASGRQLPTEGASRNDTVKIEISAQDHRHEDASLRACRRGIAGCRPHALRLRRRCGHATDTAGCRYGNAKTGCAAERAASLDRAKTVEPVSTPAATEAAPRHRRYAYRHRHRWGSYRTAYWEPFPIWWPHFHHNRIHWNRIPWLINF